MSRLQIKQDGLAEASRIILAAILLTAFCASVVPLITVTAGSMCQLECCAGRAPHASGSCMNGTCQARLSGRHSHHATPDSDDKLCAVERKIERKSFVRTGIKPAGRLSSDRITSSAFEKPCQPDCGGCASSSTSTNRQRNSAAIAGPDRPRPPTANGLANTRYHPTQTLGTQRGPGAPRGPPASLS
jgi:hypothetical protein